MAENDRNEKINTHLRDHLDSIHDWHYQEISGFLHSWAARFNERFALDIPTPAIRLTCLQRRAYGTYLRGRNGFGLRYEITINTKYLRRPLAEHLDTLLHEQIHMWQEIHGKPGKHGYHTKQFREKAASFGLIVNERGEGLGVVPGPFLDLLAEYGVDTTEIKYYNACEVDPGQARMRGQSKMKKWSCGCTNVRAAVDVNARCLSCGNEFRRAEPLW